MNGKKFWTIIFLLFLVFPVSKIHAQTNNAGFVPSDIWYSKDPFEVGDKIKIYTLIFNPDTRELSGTVDFYDNTTLLGKKTFAIPGTTVKDISINWTADVGSHSIFAKIEGAKFLVSAGKYENVTLAENQTKASDRTVKEKIIPNSTSTTSGAKTSTTSPDIQNIENTILDKTPDAIAKPISSTLENIETVRENTAITINNKKENVHNQIDSLSKSDAPVNNNKLLKPIKYAELFFFSALAFIFKNKVIFYGILILFAFLLLRFIWRKIF